MADALLFGRATYAMMEAAFRTPARTGARRDWMEPFPQTIDAAKKYIVSSTLDQVDWNAELVRGDLGSTSFTCRRTAATTGESSRPFNEFLPLRSSSVRTISQIDTTSPIQLVFTFSINVLQHICRIGLNRYAVAEVDISIKTLQSWFTSPSHM